MGKRKRRGISSREERYNEMELLEEEDSKMERINMILLTTLLIGIGVVGTLYTYLSNSLSRSEWCSAQAKARTPRKRPTWSQENERMTDRLFYRLFRMSRPCFKKLCKKLVNRIIYQQ